MIRKAQPEQAGEIHDVVVSTISEIYPKYYTTEVVEFFIGYHSPERIREDISAGKVYIAEENGRITGTGTVNGDNIERVYVRPEYRGKGIGSAMMDVLEGEILKDHEAVVVESSLPAGEFYRKRKYVQVKHMDYPVENGKILSYEVMRKTGKAGMRKSGLQDAVRLEKVTAENVWELLKLDVEESQRSFVASNRVSMIEAYTSITGNGYAFPFGIYDHSTPVGFLMVGYDADDYWEDAPEIAKGNYNLWRLMIDRNYQGRGYGREAVRLALDFIRSFPCGEAEYCWLSYEPENETARRLYRSFGFEETGDMDGEEVIAVLKL